MVSSDIPDESDYPSAQRMQEWLAREIADIQKAAELRIKDATQFVNAYARAEITASEAESRGFRYAERWGDALPGVLRSQGLSDIEIIARIDEARDRNFVKRLSGEHRYTDPTERS
jgi:hypothetical protein